MHGAGRSLQLDAGKPLLDRVQLDLRTPPKIPVPVTLEEGERELKKAEGVLFETAYTKNRGTLLLTDRRLIFNGSMVDERGIRLATWVLEWSGDDIIDVPLSWTSWKTLPLKFHHVTVKKREPDGGISSSRVRAMTMLKDYMGITTLATFDEATYEFKNVEDPGKWKSDIMSLKKEL